MEEKRNILSIEYLKRQAMAMFATLQSKRRTLPVKLTDELDQEAERCTGPAVHAVRCNRVFNEWIRDTLRHNRNTVTTHQPLAIVMFLLLNQCKDMAALKTQETLGSQMMWIPLDGLGKMNLPQQQLLQHQEVSRVYVRVEIFLTQSEDTKRFDMCVLDPDAQIPATERDLTALQRRMHEQTGVPMEALQQLTEIIRRNPEAVLDELSTYTDMQRAMAMDVESMRVCSVCKKYGYNLGKCSGCKDTAGSVYYCGRECQKADWKTHKVKCGK